MSGAAPNAEQFQAFAVPRRTHQTVLDVVTEIQREHDSTLSYRFACRVGMCGSCAMVVNGRPRWTCRTRVSELSAATAGCGWSRCAISPWSRTWRSR